MLEQESRPPSPGAVQVAELLRQHRDDILADWQRSTHALHVNREVAGVRLLDHIPELLERLAEALENAPAEGPVELPSYLSDVHAFERLDQGFDLHELTVEYGHLRRCILRRLEASPVRLRTGELARLDDAIDQVVGRAVTSYATARERTLRALDRMSQAVLDNPDADTLLSRLVALLVESSLLVDVAAVLLSEEGQLRVHSAAGLGAELARGRTQRVGEGFAGRIAAERTPLAVHSTHHEPAPRDELLHSLGLRALYGVPLMDGERLVGVAYMGSRTAYAFSNGDSLLFRTMCSRATALIIQAQLRARELAAREQVQRSLALVDTLLAVAPVGIAVLDPELRFVRVNAVMAGINGHPVEAHLGRTVAEVVTPEVRALIEPCMRKVLESGEPVLGQEVTTYEGHPEAPRHWVANYFPVRSPAGELLGVGDTVVEVTAHKRAQATLEQAVTFREQLLAVLGHDLRNPLNSITASAFQLSRAEELEDKERGAVERIRRSAGRMARMIDDILDFARSRLGGGLPVARQPMDLAEVARATLEELQVTYPDRQLLMDARGDTHGQWDPDRVTQVLGNLVVNALQHGRPGTPVRVTTRGEGPDVMLEVHNEGGPIPAELQPRLFEAFHGSPRTAGNKSLGLGLFIVQQIAQAHGGDVWVRSSAAEGTTFTVRWPRQEAAAGVPPPFAPPMPGRG